MNKEEFIEWLKASEFSYLFESARSDGFVWDDLSTGVAAEFYDALEAADLEVLNKVFGV
jgi:hypothetical protein